MDYNHITNFLDKFKTLLFQKEEFSKIISEIIKKYTNFVVEPRFIKTKNTTIYIETSPIFKSEILIYKNKILLDLKQNIPNCIFVDIK